VEKIMKRKNLTDAEKLRILELLSEIPKRNQEEIAEQTRHRKARIAEVLTDFRLMRWEDAKAFCGGREHILALRPDFVDKIIEERKTQDSTTKANILRTRHELGLPSTYVTNNGLEI